MEYDGNLCYYCGLPANSLDHTVPRTVLKRDVAGDHAGSRITKLTVPACRDCNAVLGPRVFNTLAERKQYIKRKLKIRLGRYLRMPHWTEEEILALGPLLQRSVRQALIKQRIAQERLRW